MSSKAIGFINSYFKISIMRKQVMAITGLALSGFLVAHLLGNILLVISPEAFNKYGHALVSNPLIYVAEAILLAIFLKHWFMAMYLTIQNKKARPVKYYAKNEKGGGSTWVSRTMPFSGMIILAFIIGHLLNFKYGSVYMVEYTAGEPVRDLYRTVVEYFDSALFTAWYCLAMAALGVHLSHGVQSAFQTLGFFHKKYTPLIKKAGLAFSVAVPGGFAALAIYCHFQLYSFCICNFV